MNKETKEQLKDNVKAGFLGALFGLGIVAGAYGFGYVVGKIGGK